MKSKPIQPWDDPEAEVPPWQRPPGPAAPKPKRKPLPTLRERAMREFPHVLVPVGKLLH